VLKNIINDGIPIRELAAILESLGENASKTKNIAVLTEMVRKRLSRSITEQCKNDDGKVIAITIDPALEHQMSSTLKQEAEGINLALPTEIAMDISRKTARAWKNAMDKGFDTVVLLCDAKLRSPLAVMLSRIVPMLPVVAYDEVVLGTEVEPIETISIQQAESMTSTGRELVGV